MRGKKKELKKAKKAEAEMVTEVVDFDNDVKVETGFAKGAQAMMRARLAAKGGKR